MSIVQHIFRRNRTLAVLGLVLFLLSVILALTIPFHETKILGINALIKPLKFSISLWIFCWTMALLLYYFQDKVSVKRLTVLIVVTVLYEQAVITVQALRGTLSHFNKQTPFEGILFMLMGVMITAMTLYILWATLKFGRQKDDLPKSLKSAIFWGILIFVFAGMVGGYMAAMSSHNIGGAMGGKSLPFVNWSTEYGDLRVGHFIGLHALQVIPLTGFLVHRYIKSEKKALNLIRLFSLAYFLFVSATFAQAFLGLPFLKM